VARIFPHQEQTANRTPLQIVASSRDDPADEATTPSCPRDFGHNSLIDVVIPISPGKVGIPWPKD
jgi:hypothetical protein